jgi:phage tail sheath protein FI
MAFQLSPGVNVSEIDATTIVPTVSTTTGAAVGQFNWGPVETRQLIDTEVKLVTWFGKPDSNTFVAFFSAANFLAYGNQLRVTRAANSATKNAVANNATGAALQIKNETLYEANYYAGEGDFGSFAARYPGALGNNLKVSVCGSSNVFASNASLQTGATANTGNAGDLVINTTGNSAPVVRTGDYVKVGTNPYVQVASANATAIVIASALTVAITGPTSILRKWEYADQFDSAPGTSDYAAGHNGVNDELHVIVLDEDGGISGTVGQVLEKYPFVSKASDAKSNDGSSIYYPTVLFNKSRYIYWGDHDANGTNWGNTVTGTTFTDVTQAQRLSLAGGTDQTVTDGDLQNAWALYINAEVVDVSLLVLGEADATVQTYVLNNVAEVRKDCVAFLSPARANVVNNIGFEADAVVTYRNSLPSSSYAEIDCNWKYQYDKYNDTYRYLPLNGDIAGLCVRTDTTRDAWFSPAGYDRGQIKNVVKLAWNPTLAERDTLYKNGINPVVTFPGDGTVLYGDKTMQSKPSAFDRINVRRLFIVLEKAIARASKFSLFEFNDEFTRAQFVAMVEPFLRDVQGRRGIFDYRVVADTTNNTPDVIDANSFVGDIYVKPARSINFIQLNFVAVRTGVSFDEIVGKF